MNKTLITGSTGFIGSALITFLKQNNLVPISDLTVLSTQKHAFIDSIVYSTQGYVIPQIENVKNIIHIGAFIPKNRVEAQDIEKCSSNIDFTRNLLRGLPTTLSRFVFVSTVDVYDNGLLVINESSTIYPASMYGWSKLYCEQMIREWCFQHGVSLKILRLGHIYGEGEDAYKKLIPETIKAVISNQAPSIYSNGLEKRSFLYVSDCIACIWSALSVDHEALIINIVSGNSYSVEEIVQMIVKISSKDLMPLKLNIMNDTRDFLFDNSLMVDVFGAEKVSLVDGLKAEYNYFLEKSK